jgi:hypothetical protein
MASNHDWVKAQLDQLPADFYGTLQLEVKAGAVRKVSETRTFIAPDIADERQAAEANRRLRAGGVKPLRVHDFNP